MPNLSPVSLVYYCKCIQRDSNRKTIAIKTDLHFVRGNLTAARYLGERITSHLAFQHQFLQVYKKPHTVSYTIQ